MRILTIDVGTGTQDILLFDSSTEIENCVQMIMPSPTQIVARRVREATARSHTLLLTGVTMGGGPGAWAVEDHLRANLPVYAVPDAARTFDDDLSRVEAMGIQIIPPDALQSLHHDLGPSRSTLITMEDVTLHSIHSALSGFHEPTQYDALAVAVFDHGNAPPGYSDRRFRFDYISHQLQTWGDKPISQALAAFASPSAQVHPDLTRLQAVASTIAQSDRAHPLLLLMDTGPAALLGALGDPIVREAAQGDALFVNVGNFHVLAFHIVGNRIRALFEHHTGEIDAPRLVSFLRSLAAGSLTNAEIFDTSGHGALTLPHDDTIAPTSEPTLCMVTGPRRSMLSGIPTPWPVYMAVPHGDMMLSGCYGLLRAFAVHFPQHAPDIQSRLDAPK